LAKNNRQSTRLKEYDYAQEGAYYVTICTQERKCLFGRIKDNKMVLNDAGRMIENNWNELLQRFSNIESDEFIIMPNHFHGTIYIVGAPLVGARNNRAGTRPAPTLGGIIGAFKSITTNEYIRNVKNNNWQSFNERLWQRNYYEHIIRNDKSLHKIQEYIVNNPSTWEKDKEYVS